MRFPKALCRSALIVMLSALSATADDAKPAFNWEFAGWDGGGCYPNVEYDPNVENRVYLTSDVAGVWRSNDNGENWQFLNDGLPSAHVAQIAISKSSPSIAYAATASGLAVLKEPGTAWTTADTLQGRIKFERPQSYRSVSIDPQEPEWVCVGTLHGEVFCSNNAGKIWRDLQIPTAKSGPIVALHHTADRQALVAATANGILTYGFSTHVWTAATPALKNLTDVAMTSEGFIAAADGQLWRSGPDGAQWQRALRQPSQKLHRLEFDRATSQIFASWESDWSGGLLISSDQGASWNALGRNFNFDVVRNPTREGASPGGKVMALKVNPFNAKSLFYTDLWGNWRSDDAGRTWTEKIAGTPNTVGSDLRFAPDGTLYAASMDDGLLSSKDMGRSYRMSFPSPGFNADLNGHVWRLAFAKNDRVIATSSPWANSVNQILLSDDRGRSFRRVTRGLPAQRPRVNTVWDQGYPRALVVDPNDSSLIYLGIDGNDGGGLFISHDAGETWSLSPGQPRSRRIYNGLAVDPNNSDVIYWGAIGGDGGVYRTKDRGRTWDALPVGSNSIFDILVTRDGTVYAAADANGGAIFASRDQGNTWKRIGHFSNDGTAEALTVNPHNQRMIAVGTVSWNGRMPQTIRLSYDGGETWTDITGNLPYGAGPAAMTFSPDGKELFVARHAGGIYKIALPQSP